VVRPGLAGGCGEKPPEPSEGNLRLMLLRRTETGFDLKGNTVRSLACAVGLLLLASCGPGEGTAQPEQADLSGTSFVSTKVTESGEPRPLVADTRIEATFEQGAVRWEAGCNSFGADVEITADHLLLTEIVATEAGCAGELQQQDSWLMVFFQADPRWELWGDRLTLSSGATIIELKKAQGD
jgi:heat shock protein HslJ